METMSEANAQDISYPSERESLENSKINVLLLLLLEVAPGEPYGEMCLATIFC